jgi:hypothetical protein
MSTYNIKDVPKFKRLHTKAYQYFSNNPANSSVLKFNSDNTIPIMNYGGNNIDNSTTKNPIFSGTETFVSSISMFQPYMVLDSYGNNVVIYNQIDADNTIIVLGGYSDSSNKVFEMINTVRITKNGIDNGDNKTNNPNYNPNNSVFCANPYKVANNNDYILKTKVLPSEYNGCSMCEGNGVCVNCGGNGGSGIVTTPGHTVFGKNAALTKAPTSRYAQNAGSNQAPRYAQNAGSNQAPRYTQNAGSNQVAGYGQKSNQNTSNKDIELTNTSTSEFLPIIDDFSRFGR